MAKVKVVLRPGWAHLCLIQDSIDVYEPYISMVWSGCACLGKQQSEKHRLGKRRSAIFAAITISLILFHINNRTINYNCEVKRMFQN